MIVLNSSLSSRRYIRRVGFSRNALILGTHCSFPMIRKTAQTSLRSRGSWEILEPSSGMVHIAWDSQGDSTEVYGNPTGKSTSEPDEQAACSGDTTQMLLIGRSSTGGWWAYKTISSVPYSQSQSRHVGVFCQRRPGGRQVAVPYLHQHETSGWGMLVICLRHVM